MSKDKPLGAKDVQQLFYDLVSDPNFHLDSSATKNLLTLAEYFFRTHNDDGTFKKEFRERLAKFIHEDIWAHWMKYLLEEKAQYMSEDECFAYGQYLIQREDAERWDRQMKTTYEDLPEKEKESDRNLADKLMKLLEEE